MSTGYVDKVKGVFCNNQQICTYSGFSFQRAMGRTWGKVHQISTQNLFASLSLQTCLSITGMQNREQSEGQTVMYLMIHQIHNSSIHLGPVVQSIVNLTTSSRRQLVKYMPTKLSNTLLFFVGKM